MRKLAFVLAFCLIAALGAGCRSVEEQQAAQEQRQQQQEILLRQEEKEEPRVLRVTGMGNIKAAPELATVRLAFSGQADEAEVVQALIGERVSAARAALIDLGVGYSDIETDEITVYPIQDPEKDPAEVIGYSASTTMTVTTGDTAQTGNLIGAALQAGATSVQDIVFELLDRTTVYMEALREAVKDAADKADAIAETAGLKLNGPLLVEEDVSGTELVTETVITSPAEELLQQLAEVSQLAVSAQVTVEYEIVS